MSLVGTKAQAFKATAVCPCAKGYEIKEVHFPQNGHYTLLIFYPMDFTFVCPTELVAFSDAIEGFKAEDCDVYGVSCDSEFCHMEWMNKVKKEGGLGPNFKLPLISDRSHKISKAYQALIEGEGFPLRSTVLIDGKGTIRAMTVYDTAVGRSVEESLRCLKAFKHVDKHGEVCQVNFTEGQSGMKPTQDGVKEYFKNK